MSRINHYRCVLGNLFAEDVKFLNRWITLTAKKHLLNTNYATLIILPGIQELPRKFPAKNIEKCR